MIVTELEQTCLACPSQWEGRLEDGRHIYIRFRWGFFSAGVGDDEWEAVRTNNICGEQISDGLDGTMDTDKMKEILGRYGVTFQEE